ncbi:hypothetical protein Tco_0275929 [Tanacetum coccineum]
MDNPNITIEEYIRLEEEKARRRGKVYNWETAMYGKIWDNEDVYDLGYVETEFPTIVFNDALTSEALSFEPTVSSLNNDEIDFRISFDESDDDDCTPTVSYFDDLDHFKDFEKEFPAIVYNDAQTSKLYFLTKPTVSPQLIDEFNLKDETSFSECDKEEQNVIYFNDLFPFNVIYPDDLKSDKDNDDDKIDDEHSLGDLSVKPLSDHGLYGVFVKRIQHIRHKYQYGVSWGMDTAYRLPVQFLGFYFESNQRIHEDRFALIFLCFAHDLDERKEIDELFEVSTSLEVLES